MRRRLFPGLVLASCLPCCLTAVGSAADPKPGPITRGQAEQILAGTGTITAELETQLAKPRDPRQAIMLDDVRSVMAHASEWRWYSRDHGILIAIPVRERLGISAKVNGEDALEDIVRRLVNQNGWGNPPVQVVFIEPEPPHVGPRIPCLVVEACSAPARAPVAACGCH